MPLATASRARCVPAQVFAEQAPTAIKVAEAFLKEKKTPVDYLARKVVQQTLRKNLKRYARFSNDAFTQHIVHWCSRPAMSNIVSHETNACI